MNKKTVVSVEEVKRKLERYCVYQDRCHKEVEDKLKTFHLIPEARELILLHLLEHNFLNEERFAKSFARGKFNIKKWGRVRITRELKSRNISAYNIKSALKEIEEEKYTQTLQEITEKKNSLIREEDRFKRRKKLFDFLNYRGYEIGLINDVLNEIIK
ncbi:regulatory protein RecX [Tenacibaculum agarivorans]|uniref:regulatory protein RecX n=1 Tax=Tenacibaculum agarivorans TaxID=1908389 RepID=UPI00094B85C4|nr:regulatory protein RecX [Tenacibaculum agarivorans]